MRNLWLFTSMFLMLTAITTAQDEIKEDTGFQIKVNLNNPSDEINDATAKVEAQGVKSLTSINGPINLQPSMLQKLPN